MTAIIKKVNKIVLDTNNVEFRQSGFNILTNKPDPTVTATLGTKGDLLISTDGIHYIKQDDGETTDWMEVGSGGGGSGANTTLSNLTSPTSVNQDLIPSNSNKTLGDPGQEWYETYTENLISDNITNSATTTTADLVITNSATLGGDSIATEAYVDQNGLVKAKYSFSYTDFNASATSTLELPLFSLPAKAILTDVVIHETLQFVNSGGNIITAYVGLTGLAAVYSDLTLQEVSSGITFNRATGIPVNGVLNMTTPTDIVVTLEAAGGSPEELTTLTAGTFDVYIEYKLLAT